MFKFQLNLASQSVLEGLNACFDHRNTIYIPELGKSFIRLSSTRFFACQNPVREGGGRKGLPQSFLNRFTQVYIEPLTTDDLLFIVKTCYPQLPDQLLVQMVFFNHLVRQYLYLFIPLSEREQKNQTTFCMFNVRSSYLFGIFDWNFTSFERLTLTHVTSNHVIFFF